MTTLRLCDGTTVTVPNTGLVIRRDLRTEAPADGHLSDITIRMPDGTTARVQGEYRDLGSSRLLKTDTIQTNCMYSVRTSTYEYLVSAEDLFITDSSGTDG